VAATAVLECSSIISSSSRTTHTQYSNSTHIFPFSLFVDALHPRFLKCVYPIQLLSLWRTPPAFLKAQSPANLPQNLFQRAKPYLYRKSPSLGPAYWFQDPLGKAAKSAKYFEASRRECNSFAGFWPLKTALIFNNTHAEQKIFCFLLPSKKFFRAVLLHSGAICRLLCVCSPGRKLGVQPSKVN